MTLFYKFDQNNSGGAFDIDDKVCHRVIIEADTIDEAIDKAEELGIYFNGVDKGIDCECCGDRWYVPMDDVMSGIWEFNPRTTIEEMFGDIETYAQYLADEYGWTIPDARIYYKNGEVIEIFAKEERYHDD